MSELVGLVVGGACALVGAAGAHWLMDRVERRPARRYRHDGPPFNPSGYLRG